MDGLRTFLRQHRALAFVLVALALVLKAAIPTGYMMESTSRTIALAICHDASGQNGPKEIVVTLGTADRNAVPGKPAKGECPYGALSMASLGGADAVLLALALAFIVALGFVPAGNVAFARPGYIRPPLRGPPAAI